MSSRLNRRKFLGMSGATMMTGVLANASGQIAHSAAESPSRSPGAGSPLAKRPNLILFMPDEMRADSLACYGNPVTRTPNFDRLAAEGMRFSDFYVGSSVCSPSRAALMTGCYPQRVGLPVVLDWSELHAGPERAGAAAGFLLLAGNLGGVILVLIIQGLIGNPYLSLGVLSVMGLLGLALATRLPARTSAGAGNPGGPGNADGSGGSAGPREAGTATKGE